MGLDIKTDDEPLSSDEYDSPDSPLSILSETPEIEESKPPPKKQKQKGKDNQRKIRTPAHGSFAKYNGKSKAKGRDGGDDGSTTGFADTHKEKRGLELDEEEEPFGGWGGSNSKRPKMHTTYARRLEGSPSTNIHASGKLKETTTKKMPYQTSPGRKKTEKLQSKADIKRTTFTSKKAGSKSTNTNNDSTASPRRSTRTSARANGSNEALKVPPKLPSSPASSVKSGDRLMVPGPLPGAPESPASSNEEKTRPMLNIPDLGLIQSTPPALKIPNLNPSESGESTPLSSAPPSAGVLPQSPIEIVEDGQKKCRICSRAVDEDFFDEFFFGKTQSIKLQAKFCRAHKKREAEEEYKKNGYPSVDWDGLDRRLQKHYSHLKAVINGTKTSYFKDQFAQRITQGKDRTAIEVMSSGSWEALTPGYYGTKGAKRMDQYITNKLAPELRRCAPVDRTIAARGVPVYIQSVLVPELAMLLVMDDLNVGQEKARKVLDESRELGDLVNEVAEDVMPKDMIMASQMVVWEDGSGEESNDEKS